MTRLPSSGIAREPTERFFDTTRASSDDARVCRADDRIRSALSDEADRDRAERLAASLGTSFRCPTDSRAILEFE